MPLSDLPDLRALYALRTVAEAGSLNAAGEQLGITQQAVSLRIRSLETSIGARLLIRSPRGCSLTPAGQLVIGWAGQLLGDAERFAESVAALRSGRDREVRVAASLTIAEHLLPQAVAHWRAAQGDAAPAVTLVAANSSVVADEVRLGQADLGFVEAPAVPTDLASRMIARDEIVVVVPPTHPWARRGTVTPAELADTPLVLREAGSGTRQAFDDALAAAGFTAAEPAQVLSTTLGIRTTIAAGSAPGVLSALAVHDDLVAGRLVRVAVDGLHLVRPLTAVWVGAEPPRTARGLLDAVIAATRP
ncbi:LysR family transcriptional regulator [Gordonia crocea]|uniref:LysR family transcriptional regulator n=1 Tax=Gordonia crocea TaxID=589162 RepID=A0A7I9V0U4_9ACTN|nr:LysR family transcriptional regulator [Gordonia crocea]GED99077.1 LysR family transcriptional regulator [Gordonia crocea]